MYCAPDQIPIAQRKREKKNNTTKHFYFNNVREALQRLFHITIEQHNTPKYFIVTNIHHIHISKVFHFQYRIASADEMCEFKMVD